MLARDHALSGALVFTAVAPVLHVSGPAVLAGAVFTAGAATVPDIDEQGSTISRTLGFFTETVSWIVHKVSGGHRKGTHSILGVAVFTLAAWVAVNHARGLTGKIVLGVILSLILAAGVRALRIGGHHGDVIGVAGAAAAIYWHAGLSLVPPVYRTRCGVPYRGGRAHARRVPARLAVQPPRIPPAAAPSADHHRPVRRALDCLHPAPRRALLPALARDRDSCSPESSARHVNRLHVTPTAAP